MANILKKVTNDIVEALCSSGRVLAIRVWQPAYMYEIDVYIPSINMSSWNTVKRVKCRVELLTYRDYTPANWLPDKNICTLYIEAGHDGPGSRWVKKLKIGDEILFGAAHAMNPPSRSENILCLGDGSALGHFMALSQIVKQKNIQIDTAICLSYKFDIPIASAVHRYSFGCKGEKCCSIISTTIDKSSPKPQN